MANIGLGDRVRASITGFEGFVVARTDWSGGCVRFGVQSEVLKNGKPIKPQWFDELQLAKVEPVAVARISELRKPAVDNEVAGSCIQDEKPENDAVVGGTNGAEAPHDTRMVFNHVVTTPRENRDKDILRTESCVENDVRIRELYDDRCAFATVRKERDILRVKLDQLSAAGTGYSQQTVDALTKERDELRKSLDDYIRDCDDLRDELKQAQEARETVDALTKERDDAARMSMQRSSQLCLLIQDNNITKGECDKLKQLLLEAKRDLDVVGRANGERELRIAKLRAEKEQLQKGVEQLREDYRRAAIYDSSGVIVDQDQYDALVSNHAQCKKDLEDCKTRLREGRDNDVPRAHTRHQVTEEPVAVALGDLERALRDRLAEKGRGTFASTHEIRGVLDEEFLEVREAMHEKDLDAVEAELLDLAVGAVFGYACVKLRTVEW